MVGEINRPLQLRTLLFNSGKQTNERGAGQGRTGTCQKIECVCHMLVEDNFVGIKKQKVGSTGE